MAVGYTAYGWPGVALAVSVIAFWLLLQFSRALRVMRAAAGRPIGHVDSAVMLLSKLHKGMALAQIMKITRSFGIKRGDVPETYAWQDAGGDEVVAELQDGRLAQWYLQRASSTPLPALSTALSTDASAPKIPG